MTIPVLQTERLILREFRANDIEAIANIYADEDVARFITIDGKPQSREIAWRSMAQMMGHRALRGYGMWAVEEKASGHLIGFVGPHFPEGWPGQEIGWAIAKEKWGLGYATEAARASIDYAFKKLNWPRVIHVINAANTGSSAVAEKLGSRQDGVWVRDGKELLIYAQTNPSA